MTIFNSAVEISGGDFQQNRSAMRDKVEELRQAVSTVAIGGSQIARQKHLDRDKLPVRERVSKLVDPATPFLELSQLAAWGMYDGKVPAAGIITGIARISGRECVVVANDATVKGGTYFPLTVKKHLRAQTIASENRLPCIYLVDSGGAFLPQQDEVFLDGKWEVCTTLDGCVIGNYNTFSATDSGNSGDDASGRYFAIVHAPRGKLGKFKKWCCWINKFTDPFTYW
jgi:3-methylcrotonyl-CoA carboxylase beta subunit